MSLLGELHRFSLLVLSENGGAVGLDLDVDPAKAGASIIAGILQDLAASNT